MRIPNVYKKEFLDEMKKSTHRDSFTININRYFTNALGTIINPVHLPVKLKTAMPFTVFGKYDIIDGGMKATNQVVPPINWYFLYSYIQGSAFDYFTFSGVNTVRQSIPLGCLVSLYADDPVNINNLCFVVISCPFQSYSSILMNAMNDFEIYEILYQSDNVSQYNYTIQSLELNSIGQFKNAQYQPLSFKTPEDYLANFIRMPMRFKPTWKHGLSSYYDFNTTSLSFNVKINI